MGINLPDLSQACLSWLEKIWKLSFPFDLPESIADGALLCKTLTKLLNLEVPFSESKNRDSSLRNAMSFLAACSHLGVPSFFLFAPEDLVDVRDEERVVTTLVSLILCIQTTHPGIPSLPNCNENDLRAWLQKKIPVGAESSPIQEGIEPEPVESGEEFTMDDADFNYLNESIERLHETCESMNSLVSADAQVFQEITTRLKDGNSKMDDLVKNSNELLTSWNEKLSAFTSSRNQMIIQVEKIESSQKLMGKHCLEETPTIRSKDIPRPAEKIKSPSKFLPFVRESKQAAPASKTPGEKAGLTGNLVIVIISASNLKPRVQGPQNPYCMVAAGNKIRLEQIGKTQTLQQTANPVWHETFKANIKNATTLALACKYFDRFSAGDAGGRVSVDLLAHFSHDKAGEKVLTLHLDPEGTLDVSLKFTPI